jgi:hypothetical protein
MTTAAQVKKLVKPLLDRHPDLALVGRWIYIKPVHHFARAILVDRMLDPEKIKPRWAVAHLFEWQRFFPLDWGDMLYNEGSSQPGSWRMTDQDIETAFFMEIEGKALPALRAISTLDEYLLIVSNHYSRHHLYDWPWCRIIVEAALGDLAAARATAKDNLAIWSRTGPEFDEETLAQYRRLRELCALLEADNRASIAELLHGWEAATVRNLEIEHIWHPTPFPLERQFGSI